MILLILILLLLAVLLLRTWTVRGRKLLPGKPSMAVGEAEDHAGKLSAMIACRTVSVKGSYDDTEFAKLRAVVEELFPLVHSRCERMTFGDDCWVYKLKGADESRNIMLMSHHDVVAAEEEKWSHAPFGGEISDGKIWGRGTVDTKTPLYGEFAALEALLTEGYVPECNVYIASSCNEEIAGNGIPLANAWFKEQGITFELVLDEGGGVIDPPIGGMTCEKCAMTAIHEKGRHKVKLTAAAGASHSGLNGGKKNPAERMACFLAEVSSKPGFIRRLNPQMARMLRAMAPYASFLMKLIFANLWFFGPVLTMLLPKLSAQAGGLLGTTCTFHELQTRDGGKCCTANAMLRSVDDRDFEKDFGVFLEKAKKYGIEVEKTDDWEFHAPADPTLPSFGVVADCVAEVFPDVPVIPFILPAGTDGRTLTDVCPCVVRFAPIRISAQQLASVHSEDENIDISAVGDCVVFYRRLLEHYRK